MEAWGIVGPQVGVMPRTVLLQQSDDVQAMLAKRTGPFVKHRTWHPAPVPLDYATQEDDPPIVNPESNDTTNAVGLGFLLGWYFGHHKH
jgi:hypothetical protein